VKNYDAVGLRVEQVDQNAAIARDGHRIGIEQPVRHVKIMNCRLGDVAGRGFQHIERRWHMIPRDDVQLFDCSDVARDDALFEGGHMRIEPAVEANLFPVGVGRYLGINRIDGGGEILLKRFLAKHKSTVSCGGEEMGQMA